MTETNVQPIPSNSQHHDTPNNKTHVIKFRVTAEEKASLELTCKLLNRRVHETPSGNQTDFFYCNQSRNGLTLSTFRDCTLKNMLAG